MTIAGQLGIENEHLAEFTPTMIDLGNSTNMVSSDAASQAARFANIKGMSQEKFQNLSSTLVDLGNNCATTESAIMALSLRLAGAGKQVGLFLHIMQKRCEGRTKRKPPNHCKPMAGDSERIYDTKRRS